MQLSDTFLEQARRIPEQLEDVVRLLKGSCLKAGENAVARDWRRKFRRSNGCSDPKTIVAVSAESEEVAVAVCEPLAEHAIMEGSILRDGSGGAYDEAGGIRC